MLTSLWKQTNHLLRLPQAPFAGFLICLGVYLLLTVPSLFSSKHVLFNLEPYPDGLLYILPTQHLAQGKGFVYATEPFLKAWVPPLYSVILVPLFLFGTHPELFYLTNFLLGLGTLLLVYKTVVHLRMSRWWAVFAMVLLVTQGYFLWIASVPMAENLTIFLTVFSIFWLTHPKLNKEGVSWSVSSAAGLVLTKYVNVIPAVVVGAVTLWRVLSTRKWSLLWRMVLVGLFCAMVFGVFQFWWLEKNPLAVFTPQQETKSATQLIAFSSDYLGRNLVFYGNIFLGKTSQVLWETFPVFSPLWTLILLLPFWKRTLFSKRWKMFGTLAAFTASQFIIPLFFYVADARYIFAVLPLLTIWVTIILGTLYQQKNTRNVVILTMLLLLSTQLFVQKALFRELLANNLLHRSVAWQYESVNHFNAFFATHPNAVIGTFLPPGFVELYQRSSFRVLPLSKSQEFMNISQRPWGALDYEDLTANLTTALSQGKFVYVSNAYISSQHQFSADWQQLNMQFQLKKVSEGCLNTCDIYEVRLK